MELLSFGKTGWGDELFYATLMTIAVSITAMLIGFFFALIFTPLHDGLQFVVAAHLSEKNNAPELAEQALRAVVPDLGDRSNSMA